MGAHRTVVQTCKRATCARGRVHARGVGVRGMGVRGMGVRGVGVRGVGVRAACSLCGLKQPNINVFQFGLHYVPVGGALPLMLHCGGIMARRNDCGGIKARTNARFKACNVFENDERLLLLSNSKCKRLAANTTF